MKKSYKLSDDIITGDKISRNIINAKDHLYDIIKSFSTSSENNGFFAEEIMRIAFDAINLNNLYRNHPNVDIAIIDPIEGIVEEREIISIKSSKNSKSALAVLNDAKSVKIESLLAYIVYANSNFDLSYQNKYFKLDLLKKGLDICYKKQQELNLTKVDKEEVEVESDTKSDYEIFYKKIMNVTLYYLIVNNNINQENNHISDIHSLFEKNDNLSNGTYEFYRKEVLKKLVNLNAPISLGAVYTTESKENPNDTICVFNKTNSMKLNIYWLKILDIWCTNKYFNVRSVDKENTNKEETITEATKKKKPETPSIIQKYLTGADIKKLFGLENGNFPIQIEIGTGDYKSEDLSVHAKKYKDDEKIKRYQIFNKFVDTNFGIYNNKITRTFNYMINDLAKDPKRILKYQEFLKK